MSFVFRRALRSSKLPLKEDIKRAIVRTVLGSLPISLLRRPGQPIFDKILDSPRFSPSRNDHVHQVTTLAFSGYWICQSGISSQTAPF